MKQRTGAVLGLALALGVTIGEVPCASSPEAKKPLSGYKVIVVEKFQLRTMAEKEGFPAPYADVMQKTTVAKLRVKGLFEKVVDTMESPVGEARQEGAQRLILSGEIIGYEKGSRTARVLFPYGLGQTKVKIRFSFRDATTGQEVYQAVRQGTFKGSSNLGGGSEEYAMEQAARKAVEGLIKDIAQNI